MPEINIYRCTQIIMIHEIHTHFHIRIIRKIIGSLYLTVNRLARNMILSGNICNFFSPVLQCQNMCQLFFCKRIFPSGIFFLFRNNAVIHISIQASVIVGISGYLLQFMNICCSKNLLYLVFKIHINITTFKETLWKPLSHRTVCVIEYSMEQKEVSRNNFLTLLCTHLLNMIICFFLFPLQKSLGFPHNILENFQVFQCICCFQ